MSDQTWGPTMTGGGGRRRVAGRLLKVVALLVVLALLALVLLGLWLSAQIPRQDVDGLVGGGTPMNVLVAGSDSREGLTPEQQRAVGGRPDTVEGERADTIFLMSIQGGEVALLAFPRDLWVTRCDGSTGRINVAISASPGCLVETVRDLSGLDVHHFVHVTFGGFVDVVDAVGGVEMCLDEPIADADAHIDLPAGCQVLDGTDALGYVRVRKIDDDLQRIQRQQRFVQALASEVASPSTMLNPLRLYRLGDDAGGAVSVDSRLGPVGMLRLARGARGMADGAAVTHTVPSIPERRGEAAVLVLDETPAQALFARFRDGTVFEQARAGVQPADVRVSVLNGAGISGLAARVGDMLEERGYEVAETGNADDRDDTLLRHPPGERDAAQLVADDVPGEVRLEESDDVTHLMLLLGPPAGGGG